MLRERSLPVATGPYQPPTGSDAPPSTISVDYALETIVSNMNPERLTTNPYGRLLTGADQRQVLASFVTKQWLNQAALTPSLVWSGTGPQLALTVSEVAATGPFQAWPALTAFHILALQLAAATSAPERLVRCRQCGELFPKDGKGVTCSDACHDSARRDAKRISARKRRAAGRQT